MTANEIRNRGGSLSKSVVLFAFGSKVRYDRDEPDTLPEPWKRIRKWMQGIIDMDAIIVVPSGNARLGTWRQESDVLPALFTRQRMGYLPLTLVGSCANDGVEAPFSQQSSYIKAFAPGVNVRCAKPSGTPEFDTGTSMSAGMVSFIAIGKVSCTNV